MPDAFFFYYLLLYRIFLNPQHLFLASFCSLSIHFFPRVRLSSTQVVPSLRHPQGTTHRPPTLRSLCSPNWSGLDILKNGGCRRMNPSTNANIPFPLFLSQSKLQHQFLVEFHLGIFSFYAPLSFPAWKVFWNYDCRMMIKQPSLVMRINSRVSKNQWSRTNNRETSRVSHFSQLFQTTQKNIVFECSTKV